MENFKLFRPDKQWPEPLPEKKRKEKKKEEKNHKNEGNEKEESNRRIRLWKADLREIEKEIISLEQQIQLGMGNHYELQKLIQQKKEDINLIKNWIKMEEGKLEN